MDGSPEPMDVDQQHEDLSTYEQQKNSLLLMLPDEIQWKILAYVGLPTFTKFDWMTNKTYDSKKLVLEIYMKLERVDSSIKYALCRCAYSCKQLCQNTAKMLKDRREWIRQQYTVDNIAQALKEALSRSKILLSDIISSNRGGISMSVLQVAINIGMQKDVVKVLLLSCDDQPKLVFYRNEAKQDALYYATIYCKDKDIFMMLFQAAGDRVKDLMYREVVFVDAHTLEKAINNKAFAAAIFEIFGGPLNDRPEPADEESQSSACVLTGDACCTII